MHLRSRIQEVTIKKTREEEEEVMLRAKFLRRRCLGDALSHHITVQERRREEERRRREEKEARRLAAEAKAKEVECARRMRHTTAQCVVSLGRAAAARRSSRGGAHQRRSRPQKIGARARGASCQAAHGERWVVAQV